MPNPSDPLSSEAGAALDSPPVLRKSTGSSIDREAVLLVNTRSLKGSEWLDQAKTKLSERGVRLAYCQGFSKASELIAQAKNQIAPDRLVIIGGGDGTLNAVANLLHKSSAVLGVLPLGTGNAFARDMGIPTDLDKAIDILIDGNVEQVDMGKCGDRFFLNVATIGLTALVAKNLTVPLKRRFGRFVYALALINAVRNVQPFEAVIETENGSTDVNTVQLVIGNGHYHGGPLPLSPTASITSGKLRLYAVQYTTKAALLRYALLLPTGLQGLLKEVHSEKTVGGTILTKPTQDIVIDGEMGTKTPLHFSVEPLSLSVMAPKEFAG
jgi:YegS/Rv2252/BmrU family lipid kinase